MSKTTGELSWREARRQNARADLLAVAWEMVREGGLGAMSLRELARRAGITTPTVYAYFESKNAILDAMFGEAAESFEQSNAEPPFKHPYHAADGGRRNIHLGRRSGEAAAAGRRLERLDAIQVGQAAHGHHQ